MPWTMRACRISLLSACYAVAMTWCLSSAAADAVTDIPSAVARKLELIKLLKAEQFEELERRITAILDNVEAGVPDKDEERKLLYAFSRADPDMGSLLADWRIEFPRSAAAHLAFGLYNERAGRAVRGADFANYTNERRFAEMRQYFEAAKESLRVAVTLRPKTDVAWERLLLIATIMSDRAHLASLFQEAVSHVPASSIVYWIYYNEALHPKWGGSSEQQAALKQQMQVLFQGNPDFAWVEEEDEMKQAWALFYKEDYQAALAGFEWLISKRPSGSSREGRALSLYYLNRHAEGIAEMQRALATNPGNKYYYIRLAGLQRHMKDKELWRAAERNLDIAVSLDPYDPDTLLKRADFLRKHGKEEAARRDMDRALYFGANDDDVRESRRRYFLSIDELEVAVAEGAQMVKLVPLRPRNYYAYGSTLYRDRDCLAREMLNRYVDLCRMPSDDCMRDAMISANMMLDAMAELCR